MQILQIISPQKALRLALGNDENQLSRPKLEDEFILPLNIPSWSIWHEQYKSVVEREKSERERRINQQFGAFRVSKSLEAILSTERLAFSFLAIQIARQTTSRDSTEPFFNFQC
jgi:hypothetical protein